MIPYKKSKSPIKKFKEAEQNDIGKFYLVLKILGGAKKEKDWSAVSEAINMMSNMLKSLEESKNKRK